MLDWLKQRWHHVVFLVTLAGAVALAYILVGLGFDPAWQTRLANFPAAIGALLGPFLGLVALMFGALYNAKLTRDRDERLRDLEGRAVAAAIRGELASMKISIADLLPIWKTGEDVFSTVRNKQSSFPGGIGTPIDATEYAKLPPSHATIFEANASRIGLLGSNLAGAVTVVYTNYRVRDEVFKQPFGMMTDDLPEHFAEQIKWGKKFCKDCGDIERFLIEFEKTGGSASLVAEAAEFWESRENSGDRILNPEPWEYRG